MTMQVFDGSNGSILTIEPRADGATIARLFKSSIAEEWGKVYDDGAIEEVALDAVARASRQFGETFVRRNDA